MSFSACFKRALTDAEMPSLSTQRYTRLDLKGSADFFACLIFQNVHAFSCIKSLSRYQGHAKHTLEMQQSFLT